MFAAVGLNSGSLMSERNLVLSLTSPSYSVLMKRSATRASKDAEAQVNRDSASLDALVAERFINTEYDGEVSDKTKILSDIKDSLFKPNTANIQGVKANL